MGDVTMASRGSWSPPFPSLVVRKGRKIWLRVLPSGGGAGDGDMADPVLVVVVFGRFRFLIK